MLSLLPNHADKPESSLAFAMANPPPNKTMTPQGNFWATVFQWRIGEYDGLPPSARQNILGILAGRRNNSTLSKMHGVESDTYPSNELAFPHPPMFSGALNSRVSLVI